MVKWCTIEVCAVGYGYLSKFIFKDYALGIRGIGVTSKSIKYGSSNIIFVNRKKLKKF